MLQAILANIIIFLTANFINRLIIQNRLSKHLTLLPGLFFILITAIIPTGLILSPAILSLFFILLAVINLHRTYKNREFSVHIFNSGLYLGIGFIIYPSISFLWFFGLIALLNMRSFKITEFLIYCSGCFTPLFLLSAKYYWNDNFGLINEYFQLSPGFLMIFNGFDLKSILYLSTALMLIIFIILNYNKYTMKSSIQVQKKIDILYWFMLFSFLMMFFGDNIGYSHFFLLAFPLGVFIGLSYEKMKNSLMAELIHVVLIIGILFIHFQNLI